MEDRDAESESEDLGDMEEASHQEHGQRNSREMRNQAEKNRRDKLNKFITELSHLVPASLSSTKKLDKTSILRLSAAFLREHRLIPACSSVDAIPAFLKPFNLIGVFLEDLDAIYFVITCSGKIVCVSETVERILGHTQTELLGKSLFDITCPDDHDDLREQLTADAAPAPEDDADGRALVPVTTPTNGWTSQRRSFYLKIRHRSGSRADQAHYELVYVEGILHIPPKSHNNHRHGEASSSNGSGSSSSLASEEAFMVALVRLFREPSLNQDSLLEASKEEYITRHTMDGRIIFCDQRISIVSGYLPDEVVGLSAFMYMHRDDVRWTVVALRQMFTRGEDYGCSCYRLKTKSNEFIYLKTYGYLEKDRETNTVDSFICINILVPKEEGIAAMRDLQSRFSPQFQLKDSPARKSGVIIEEVTDQPEPVPTAPEEREIEKQVNYLLMSVPDQPEPMSPPKPSGPAPHAEYARVTFVSRSLPRASVHTAKAGIKDVPKLGPGLGGQSPRTPQSPSANLLTHQPVLSPQMHSPQMHSPQMHSPQMHSPQMHSPQMHSPQMHSPQMHSPQMHSPQEAHERPSVVCGPRSSQPSTSGVTPISAPTTPEAVRTSVISGLKRSYDTNSSRESSSREKDSPRKKCNRTRTRLDSDSSEDSSRRGFTPPPTQGLDVDDAYPADLAALPVVAESSVVAVLPGYDSGGWTPQQHDEINLPEEDLFPGQPLETISNFGLDDVIVASADLRNALQVADNSFLDSSVDPHKPRDAVQQLLLQQLQLGTCMQAQNKQVTDIAQGLQQVPVDTPQRQIYEDKVVQLTVEHSRQEKLLQELKRETHNIQRDYPMGAQ